jgi:hypothetical protein
VTEKLSGGAASLSDRWKLLICEGWSAPVTTRTTTAPALGYLLGSRPAP